jgi:hypothetical protein
MQSKAPACRCGHTRTHHMVSPKGRYSQWGWFTLFLGVTARPVRVEYWCRQCGQKVDETTDPAVLDAHC